MAVAGSLATGDVVESILFMAFFGLGTLPIMWSIVFFWKLCRLGYPAKNPQGISLHDGINGLFTYTERYGVRHTLCKPEIEYRKTCGSGLLQ